MDSKAMGKHLKARRTELGLDVEDISAHLNISTYTYKQYETGRRLPGLHAFVELCNYLKTTPEFLLAADLSPVVAEADSNYVKSFQKLFSLSERELLMTDDYIEMLKANRKKYRAAKWHPSSDPQ